VRHLDARQAAERPEQHLVRLAVHAAGGVAVAQLVQQHRDEQQAHQHGGVLPRPGDDPLLVRHAQHQAEHH
jgi:hypothetical protein